MRRKKRAKIVVKRESKLSRLLGHPVIQTVSGIGWIAVAFLCFISLVSFNPGDQSYNTYTSQGTIRNLCGKPGAFIADQLFQAFGYPAFLVVVFFGVLGYVKVRRRQVSLKVLRAIGACITLVSISTMFNVIMSGDRSSPGPFMSGGWIGEFLSLTALGYFTKPSTIIITVLLSSLSVFMWMGSMAVQIPIFVLRKAIVGGRKLGQIGVRVWIYLRHVFVPARQEEDPGLVVPVQKSAEVETEKKAPVRKEPVREKKEKVIQENMNFGDTGYSYQFPSLSMLKEPRPVDRSAMEKDLEKNSVILGDKLHDFGVEGRVTQVIPGPVITQYEFEPAPGIKLNKIINLSEDLALALKAKFVPRVAHIPGKSVVGVEIPNVEREVVYIKDLIGTEVFQKYQGKLKIALGKDIRGAPYITHLESMPHLLVAGATGSGKSVCINSILVSFLYALSPQELQLLLIDPKMLELSVYNGIPHLRESVITDPKRQPQLSNGQSVRWKTGTICLL